MLSLSLAPPLTQPHICAASVGEMLSWTNVVNPDAEKEKAKGSDAEAAGPGNAAHSTEASPSDLVAKKLKELMDSAMAKK